MKKAIIGLAVLTALTSASAFAHKEGDFIVRAGLASVVPNDDSGSVADVDAFGLEVDSNTQFAFTVGYMFTDNISFEVLGASPFSHDISANSALSDALGEGKIAETKHLPPTFMVQYYFGQADSKLRPYVGAGINYTVFFDDKFTNSAKSKTLNNLSLDDSWGLAANVGLDYMLNDDWFINGSIWYADIDTEASYDFGGTKYTTDVDIDPWVFMIAGGYKF
ncbi:outer membrane protein OmpW [Vibrio ponticus]|uniref:Outer membrane protein OmpW n=1 Tax=Vibrio ponticus TaxID=265668 RepID=A0ABX3FNR7_9VIBR|nr:outer membrane protein OmpW [Vibrio ponticus]OLQ94396.1 outer membrane protein OmpW [Vibrio ponticus]